MEIRDRIKELRRVKARDLIPNPKNWRLHPKAQAAVLRGLLNEIGYADALLARELADGRLMLIDGHLRAESTPDQEVPVLVLDVTAEEAEKIMLTLDPLAAMASADAGRLGALLETARFSAADVSALLERIAGQNGLDALGRPEVMQDQVPIGKAAQLQKKWRTELGQFWQIGPHRLLCGDSREVRAEFFREHKIRLIWTDPPYGVNYANKNRFLNRSGRGNRIEKPISNDHLNRPEIEALFRDALAAAVPHCGEGAAIYVTAPGGSLQMCFIRALGSAGFTYKQGLVWVKNQFVIGMSDYHFQHEPVLYGWLENGPHYWCGGRSQSSIFEVDKPHVSDLHSTMKPIELIARMVRNSSQPGAIVYDPFSGSGSTLVAAQQLGRIGYAVELDPGYVAVTLERLSMLGLQPRLVN